MQLAFVKRQTYLMGLVSFVFLFLLTACGGSSSSTGASTPTATTSNPTQTATTAPVSVAPATATATAMLQLMTLVGQPTAKLVTGQHTFAVSGQLHNGDSKQHDVYVQALLLDDSGAIVGASAFFNVDNIPGGGTSSFTIQGTTIQATWASVQVKIIAVSENLSAPGDN